MLTPASETLQRAGNVERLVPIGMRLPFILVTSLFFLWGVPNNLNDVLIRQFMKSFAISRSEAGSSMTRWSRNRRR
jgi:FHS family L-fucose permease-like MFS transporter